MTLVDLAKGDAGPRWVHAAAYTVLLVGLALPVWRQVDETFQFTNNAFEEARRHFDEVPLATSVMVQGVGEVTLQYFPSDRCVRVFRDDMMTAKWVTYDDFAASRGALEDVTGVVAALHAQGTCIAAEAHRGAPETSFGEREGEMVQVTYRFPDGCVGWTWCHVSGSFCQTHKDGTLAMTWTRCVH
jgi:hypothetical protein